MRLELRELEPVEGYLSLALVGSLDINSIANVEARFLTLTLGGKRNTIVDLSQLTFISSLGIGMLVAATKGLKKLGAKLVLAAPTENVAAVLASAGLSYFLLIVPSLGAAQELLAGSTRTVSGFPGSAAAS